jgi:hypothetical protein
VNRRSLGFWLWPTGAAVGIAISVGLDILLIAAGVVPAVPGLFFTITYPTVAGLLAGFGNRRAGVVDLLLMALLTAGALYYLLFALSFIGLALSSNVSCSEPNAPVNCDNDIGAAVGVFIGLPIALIFSIVMWLGSIAGVAIRSQFTLPVSSLRVGGRRGDSS